jgi:Flp pilus assembly protein TadD
VLVLGVWRSEARTRVWRDDLTLVAQTAIDAPTSYLARYQWGRALFQLGRPADGEREMRQAIALYPGDPNPYTELAGEYQRAGMCTPAAALYRQALVILPTRPDARAGLADCLWRAGDYAGSRAQARIGLAYGYHAATFRRLAARADSAWRQAHPPADDRAAVAWRPVRASRQE